jgi:chloramphenicol 3-O-phosphotransferase
MTTDTNQTHGPSSILIVSGPPGSGKTTVARCLAETAERPTVHLLTDSFYVAIKKGFVAPFLPEAAKQNEVVMGVLVNSMLGYATGGYDVVVDGIIGPWSLPAFCDAANQVGVPLSFVVLRPSLETSLSRARGREGRQLKNSGPIRGLYGAFAELGPLEPNAIDSTIQTGRETVDHVRDGLAACRFRLRVPEV